MRPSRFSAGDSATRETSVSFDPGSPTASPSRNSNLAQENASLRSQLREATTRLSILEAERRQQTDHSRRSFSGENEIQRKTITPEREVNSTAHLQLQIESLLSFLSARTGRPVPDISRATTVCSDLIGIAAAAEERASRLHDRNSSLEQSVAEAEEVVVGLRAENRKLKKQLRRIETATDAGVIVEEEKARLQRKHERTVSDLQQALAHKSAEIETLQASLQRLRESLANPNTSQMRDGTTSKEAYEARLTTLTQEVAAARRRVKEVELANDALLEEQADRTVVLSTAAEERESSLHELARKDAKISKQRARERKLRELCQSLETRLGETAAKLAEQNAVVHELHLEVDRLRRAEVKTVTTDGSEVSGLRAEVELKEKVIGDLKKLLEANDAIGNLADLRQRPFIAQLAQWDAFLRQVEQYTDSLVREKEAVERANQNQAAAFAAQNRKQTAEFFAVLERIRRFVPEDIVPLESEDVVGAFEATVQHLIGRIGELETAIENSPEAARLAAVTKEHSVMLGHLSAVYRFLKQAAGTRLFTREVTRNELIAECARLGKYLSDHQGNSEIASIFDIEGMTDPQTAMSAFLGLVSDEQLEQSPLKELVTLFLFVTQLNGILARKFHAQSAWLSKAEDLEVQADGLYDRVQELEQWKSALDQTVARLSPVLAACIDDPPSDFIALSAKFIETFPERQIALRERPALLEQIALLEQHIQHLEQSLQEREKKHKHARTQFCREADELTNRLETDLIIQEQRACDTQARLEAEIAELKGRISAQIPENTESFRPTLGLCGEQVCENCAALTSAIERLNEKCRAQEEKIVELTTACRAECEEHETIAAALAAKNQKLKELRHALAHCKKANAQVLEELQERTDRLENEYTAQIGATGRDNAGLKAELLAKITELESSQKTVLQLRDANAELQAKQHTLKCRLDEVNRALDRERDTAAGKQKAIANSVQAEADAVIHPLQKTVEQARRLFVRILADEFGVSDIGQTIEDAIEQINRELRKRAARQAIFADSLKLRRTLGFDDSEASLSDAFADRMAKLGEQQERIEQLENSNGKLRTENEACKSEISRLEQYKPETAQWTNWSRTLLAQLMGPRAKVISAGDVRMLLEEACLSSVGHRSLLSKLALLRDQKKLLTNSRITIKTACLGPRSRKSVTSVRPIIVAFLALRQIQGLTGVLPINFASQSEIDTDLVLPKRPRFGQCV